MKKFKKLAAILTSAALMCSVAAAPASAAEYQYGDANLDGTVNIADVIFINRALLGDAEMTNEQAMYADVDGQPTVSPGDSLQILKFIVELVPELTPTVQPTEPEETTESSEETEPAETTTEVAIETDPVEPEETTTSEEETTTAVDTTTSEEETTTVEDTTASEEETTVEDTTASEEETTADEGTTTSEEETSADEETTTSEEETTTVEDTTTSEEETTTVEETTTSEEETTTAEDTTTSEEETTTVEDTTTSEDETTTEDTTTSEEETTTEETEVTGLTGETEVREASTDADGNTVVYVARGDVLEIAITGGEPNANVNGGIGYNDPVTGEWTDTMIGWSTTLDADGNGVVYFEVPDGLASLQFQTWYYGLGSETYDKESLDMTFTVQLDPEQSLDSTKKLEERELTERTDTEGNINLYLDVTGAEKVEIAFANGTAGAAANGCVAYTDPETRKWTQINWNTDFAPDGTALVYITLPTGVEDMQYQIWWYGGEDQSALTTTCTVQLTADAEVAE